MAAAAVDGEGSDEQQLHPSTSAAQQQQQLQELERRLQQDLLGNVSRLVDAKISARFFAFISKFFPIYIFYANKNINF
jgi:hypothetical protein